MSPMKRSGISTAIRDTVSDMMVKPICSAPLSAATCCAYCALVGRAGSAAAGGAGAEIKPEPAGYRDQAQHRGIAGLDRADIAAFSASVKDIPPAER